MSNVKILKDSSGNYIYPITHEDIVFDTDGVPVSEKYQTKNEAEEDKNVINGNIETIEGNIETIEGNIETINGNIETINGNIETIEGNIETIEGNINVHFVDVDNITSVDSVDGYLKNIEILGNTIQNAENLADIRSVGDKLENQELYEIPVLSTGKNLTNMDIKIGIIHTSDGSFNANNSDYYSNVNFDVVKQNTQYAISSDKTINVVFFYDKDMKYISNQDIQTTSKVITTPSECRYIRYRFVVSNKPTWIQIEEGTVATEYEPYQEDKLTILSSVPLEKVGDVADRIICKDGVWGVEKNIETLKLSDFKKGYIGLIGSTGHRYSFELDNVKYITKNYLDYISGFTTLPYQQSWDTSSSNWFTELRDGTFSIHFCLTNEDNNKLYGSSWDKVINGFINFSIKLKTTQPQFIPLPHDQQIALRTFANKTNISFLTEIEGTIKAQVPKSIGATVNSHSEQIDNLSKELDRVKKLEESTASTVTTESDFTTVENTSNGYFEDVKLEGRTLVNLSAWVFPYSSWQGGQGKWLYTLNKKLNLEVGRTYSICVFGKCADFDSAELGHPNSLSPNQITINQLNKFFKFTAREITENGLALIINKTVSSEYTEEEKSSFKAIILEGDHTQNPPSYFEGLKSVGQDVDEISVLSTNKEETKEDKKRILYYNTETDTWEKPVLRQFDTIEKHSDNKYYYHVRSEEVPYTEGDETKVDHITDMTTTVKKASTEKVYECTNLDLITYSDETNFMVKSGVLSPKTTLKVHSNIANVITLLQEKVSMLENQCIQMFKFILSGDYQSLAYSLYPKDFTEENNDENSDI